MVESEEDSDVTVPCSGSPSTTAATREPNNIGGNENCVHNNHEEDEKWNDVECSFTYPSVCASRILCP
ncbi:lactose-binding lectin l-2-like [Scomber scombrus]|uniref:Lactose-binding lectin l-2-like n=1 Tax=Scomber scombrus TaxID=13677 RepID=A0AAV1MRG3_SCOSC